jgi:hypothetical protein
MISIPTVSRQTARHDQNLAAIACGVLRDSDYLAVRRVCCELVDGGLLLSGVVPTYHHKQVAQSLLLAAFDHGVCIENRVLVSDSRDGGQDARRERVTHRALRVIENLDAKQRHRVA